MAKKTLQLGRAVDWPHTPEEAQLDRVPNPQVGTDYLVRFTVPDGTVAAGVEIAKTLHRKLPQPRRLP
jgi:hypothetical protein